MKLVLWTKMHPPPAMPNNPAEPYLPQVTCPPLAVPMLKLRKRKVRAAHRYDYALCNLKVEEPAARARSLAFSGVSYSTWFGKSGAGKDLVPSATHLAEAVFTPAG